MYQLSICDTIISSFYRYILVVKHVYIKNVWPVEYTPKSRTCDRNQNTETCCLIFLKLVFIYYLFNLGQYFYFIVGDTVTLFFIIIDPLHWLLTSSAPERLNTKPDASDLDPHELPWAITGALDDLCLLVDLIISVL